jgi:hypothetical protein
MNELRVEEVYAATEDGVFVVAFRGGGDDEAVIFSRDDRLSSQDAMLGMDTYSISMAGATVYGGVTSATVFDYVLVFGLSDDAGASLGLLGDVRLRLRDETTVETAVTGLRRLGISVDRA